MKHKRFSELKADIARTWTALPRKADVISPGLREKIRSNAAKLEKSQLSQPSDPQQQAASHA